MMKSVTKEKVFHVLKMILLAITVTLVLLLVQADASWHRSQGIRTK